MRRTVRKIGLILAVVGPGIITANVDNDASGITTYSVAGARYGLALLWTLVPVTVSLVVVQEMVARMAVATGKGLSELIREKYGVRSAFYMMLALFIANLGTTVANLSGWAASMQILGFSKYVTVPFGAFIIWLLVTKGTYRVVEKILLFACVIYIGYIISGIMAKPQWSAVFKALLIPNLYPEKEYIYLVIAIIGTTITPWMQFYLQSSIAQKGINKDEYHITRWDVVIGSFMTDIVSFFIIVTCATVLFPAGITIKDAHEAAIALRPFAGGGAAVLFAISLANASLLGAIIVPLATAYYTCEAMGWEAGVNRTFKEAPQFMWIYTSMIVISAAFVMIPGAPLISLMVLASVLNGLVLPFVLVYALKLSNDRSLMGELINKRSFNLIAWATTVIIIVLTLILIGFTIL